MQVEKPITDAEDYLDWSAEDEGACTDPKGHEWVRTGTAYGGDDERWGGEGRCYCIHCGADGDA